MSTRFTFDTDDRNDPGSGYTPLPGPFDALSLLGDFRSMLSQSKTNDSGSAYLTDLTDLTALFDLADPIPPSDGAPKDGDNDSKDLTFFISANADPIRALMDKHNIPADLATEVKELLDVQAANGKPKFNEQQALELARRTLSMTRQEPSLGLADRIRLVELARTFGGNKNPPEITVATKTVHDVALAFWTIAENENSKLNAANDWQKASDILSRDFNKDAETRALLRLLLANPEVSTSVIKALPVDTLLELRGSAGVLEHLFNSRAACTEVRPKLEEFIDRCIPDLSKLTSEERKAIADVYARATKGTATAPVSPTTALSKSADQVCRLIALDPRQIIDCAKVSNFVTGSSELYVIRHAATLLARRGSLPHVVEALKLLETSLADEKDKTGQPYRRRKQAFENFANCFSAEFIDIPNQPNKPALISRLAQVGNNDLLYLLKNHKSLSITSVGVVEAALDERFRSGNHSAKEWLEVMHAGANRSNLRDTFLRIAANLPLHEKQKLTNAEISDFHKLWERLLGNKTNNFEALRLLKSQLDFPEAGLTFPTNLRESLYKEGLKDFLKNLPPAQQAKMVTKLLEIAGGPTDKELVLRCASPEAFVHLDAKTLDLVKTQLETIVSGKENANGAEFLRRVNAVSERRTGQQLDPEFARAILEHFAPEDRQKIIEYLQVRASHCSIAGMDEIFRDLAKELSPGGSRLDFVRPVGRARGRMAPEIDVLVTRDGSGAGRCYNNLKETGFNHQIYYMDIEGRKPVVTDPTGNRFELVEQGGKVFGKKIVDGATGERVSTAELTELPKFVLFDKPGTNQGGWSDYLKTMEKSDRLFVPERLTGSLDGRVKGFAEGINYLDVAVAHGDPRRIEDFAAKLRAHALGADAKPPSGPQPVGAEELASFRDVIKTKASVEGVVLALQLCLRLDTPVPRDEILRMVESANFRTLQEFAQISREVCSKIEARLNELNIRLSDAVFVIPKCAGSEHLIHELFRRANPHITAEQFVTMSELPQKNLEGKTVILLDDGFDFGKECLKEKLGKTLDIIRASPTGGETRTIIASLFAFETADKRATAINEFLEYGRIPEGDEKKVDTRKTSVGKVECVVGREVTTSFADTVKDIRPGLAQIEGVRIPTYIGTTTQSGVAEIWPYLVPNNTSKWLRDFVKEMGHYSTRVHEPFSLYEPLVVIAPDYLKEVAGKGLTSAECADVLLKHIDHHLRKYESGRRDSGSQPKPAELALIAFREFLVFSQSQSNVDSALSVVVKSFNGMSTESAIALADLRRDLIEGRSVWSHAGSQAANHESTYVFKPFEIDFEGKRIIISRVECKGGEIKLTYMENGAEAVEIVDREGKSKTANSWLSESLAKALAGESYPNNNFDRAHVWAILLDRLTGDSPNPARDIKDEARAGVISLTFPTDNCARSYSFKFDKPVEIEYGGKKYQITGIESIKGPGGVELKASLDGSPVDRATTDKIRDFLLKEISDQSLSRVTENNEIKAKALTAYLERIAGIREDLPKQIAMHKFGAITDVETAFLKEVLAEMRKLGGSNTFDRNFFDAALDEVMRRRSGGSPSVDEAAKLARVMEIVESYKRSEIAGLGRVDRFLMEHNVIPRTASFVTTNPEAALGYDPVGSVYTAGRTEIRMTDRGPVFVIEGREVEYDKLTKKNIEDLLDEEIRLKRRDIDRKGIQVTKEEISELNKLEQLRQELSREAEVPRAIRDGIKARLGRGAGHLLVLGVVINSCLDWYEKLNASR